MAKQKVTPFLWFDGQAEQAAMFYTSLLPDSRINHIARSPAKTPSGPEGMVLTVEFTLAGSRYVALNGGPMYSFTEAISFQISCTDQAEVDHLWNTIIQHGGTESRCGWLKDKWGLSWQIIPGRLIELLSDKDPTRSRRAMQAMLKMSKIIITDIEHAADGK